MKTLPRSLCVICVLCGFALMPSCTTEPKAVDPFDAMLAKAMQAIADDMKPETEKP